MDDGPHAGRNQPTDSDVIHAGAHDHPCIMGASGHCVPDGTGEETEKGGGGKYKRRYVPRRGGDPWKVVTKPDHPWYKMGMDVHWIIV